MQAVNYCSLEECVLACFILKPELMETTKLEEKHFENYKYTFIFFRNFYAKYNCLDINLIYSILEETKIKDFINLVCKLMDVFVILTHFPYYEKALIDAYAKSKKEEWLKKKIYEKATQLVVGSISLNEFNKELDNLYKYAKKVEWK